jgi:putative membrane protein
MKTTYVLPLAATLSLALLGACSKPASEAAGDTGVATANAAPNVAQDAGNATTDATGPGGAVSPPEANGAVNTDANKTSSDVKPAANSFTESQAKGHIENAGYTEVTGLTKTPDGMWTAKAKKGGKTMNVAIDFKGAVTAK